MPHPTFCYAFTLVKGLVIPYLHRCLISNITLQFVQKLITYLRCPFDSLLCRSALQIIPGTIVSSINKTDLHDIREILLKGMLNNQHQSDDILSRNVDFM